MSTVYTPEAVERMVAAGTFKKCLFKDIKKINCDEIYIFIFPAKDVLNEMNRDGEWIEVEDYGRDGKTIYTSAGEMQVTGETEIYYR